VNFLTALDFVMDSITIILFKEAKEQVIYGGIE